MEWDVYFDGRYMGTVSAANEQEARLAALHKFDAYEVDSISVSRRK